MTDKPLKDDSMEQHWRNNTDRQTLDGTLKMARTGDKTAIRTLMGNFVAKVENGRPPSPELMQWISQAFVKILGRESADVAFQLRPGSGGKKPKRDSGQLEERVEIASFVLSNSSPESYGSVTKAKDRAAEIFKTSRSNVDSAYNDFKPRRKS